MMNVDIPEKIIKKEVFHKDYNLDNKDNIEELPGLSAVYGIFAIVNEEPVNCRFIGKSSNLKKSVRELFESPSDEGVKEFMQGPWIKFIMYQEAEEAEINTMYNGWLNDYKPKVDKDGEYPGYYN